LRFDPARILDAKSASSLAAPTPFVDPLRRRFSSLRTPRGASIFPTFTMPHSESGGRRSMKADRRQALKAGSAFTLLTLVAAAGWLKPGEAAAEAWNKGAFETHSMDETLKALGGSTPTPSKDIAFFSTPDIAENGAVVPIGITSSVPKTESIAILIEKNPNMLAAVFDIPPGTNPSLSTRIKMGQTSNVYALVKADGKYYVTSKEIKVTLGGCGG
jgi:sulfur-oxidizing protein SoxY